MMNSGLPSLLDAIFGKQDLDSVSLEEMYELINEFPSFNAGHFLLSKKLKLENSGAFYEKETMRTALYFNNPFWLQSVLNEENRPVAVHPKPIYSEGNGKDDSLGVTHTDESVSMVTVFVAEEKLPETEPSILPELSSEQITLTEQFFKEELHESMGTEAEPVFNEEPSTDFPSRPVTSFDDLLSKYRIGPIESIQETKAEPTDELNRPRVEETPESDETRSEEANQPELWAKSTQVQVDDESHDFKLEENKNEYEIREEVFNEYGIFEEVVIKRTDFDLEAFDRPAVPLTTTPEEPVVNARDEVKPEDQLPEDAQAAEEILEPVNETMVENPVAEDTDDKPAESDNEAFDRPIDTPAVDEVREEPEAQEKVWTALQTHTTFMQEGRSPDDAGEGDTDAEKEDSSGNGQIPGLAARFNEQQKVRAPFDPKKAESIVFAPYHMIDYFASQGIKLILEENPADPFGKQLKSFTDWLKVMKKIPMQPVTEKTDDKEVDRIRHFAAHSIDEREILTESMAEVLAKQGMYENAIALYQKLSLIYPPKSAYFASRIEQLKASIP